MTSTMKFHVHSLCRRNGQPDAIGVAAAVLKTGSESTKTFVRRLPSDPTPTDSRAEIEAMILALEMALGQLLYIWRPPSIVKIYSDSKYAIDGMIDLTHIWRSSEWIDWNGEIVEVRDLIRKAGYFEDKVKEQGSVECISVPIGENQGPDRLCIMELTKMEDEEEMARNGRDSIERR